METTSPTPVDMPTPTNIKPWGFHAILDCNACDVAKLQDPENILSWLENVMHTIGLVAAAPVLIQQTGANDPARAGFSVMQLVEASSITAHFVDDGGHIYIDILSNKEYDPNVIEALIKQYFGSNTIVKKILIPRNTLV